MISKKVISLYGAESQEIGQKREIQGGPLYDKNHVLRLLDEEKIVIWTRKCLGDLQRWEIDPEDVAELIKTALDKGVFLGSQWCEQERNDPWAACDAYRIFRSEWSHVAHKEISVQRAVEYYVKFAINKKGRLLLVISCHPSGY